MKRQISFSASNKILEKEVQLYSNQINEHFRIKRNQLIQSKQLAKEAQQKYNRVFSQQIRANNSISKLHKEQNAIKVHFMKVYTHRKTKIQLQKNHEKANLQKIEKNNSLIEKASNQKKQIQLKQADRKAAMSQLNDIVNKIHKEEKQHTRNKSFQIRQKINQIKRSSHDEIKKRRQSLSNIKKEMNNFRIQTARITYQTKFKNEIQLSDKYQGLCTQLLSENDKFIFKDLVDTFYITTELPKKINN